jgi:hypothetical protein
LPPGRRQPAISQSCNQEDRAVSARRADRHNGGWSHTNCRPTRDPRDPKVDPIDWVERIPLSETRNYIQRVMENLQVYRVRFGGGSRLLIEADLRRGAELI